MAAAKKASAKLAVGDIIRLKSGGPTMTIDSIYDHADGLTYTYRCKWFAGKKLEESAFHSGAVEAVEPGTDTSG